MKLIGGDSGRMEHEEFVSEVLIAPSERVVVDVLLDQPGQLTLEHQTPNRTYPLVSIAVVEERAEPSLADEFRRLRTAPELVAERSQLDDWLAASPDKVLALVAEMDDPTAAQLETGPTVYACPMHPDITSDQPGRCPRCGMKLLATGPVTHPVGERMPHTAAGNAHHQHGHNAEDHGMEHHGMEHESTGQHGADEDASGSRHKENGAADGIEWEDDMVEINRLTTTANMRWKFVDRTTGAATAAIEWRFTVGDRVKIRLVNEMDSDHPMHHPFHLHGAGRFLVLARDGAPEHNLVWKDTVLVRTGQTVDILFDVTNPGLWMAHCHIAEHMQSGMMFSFTVDRGAAR
jgi:FtsP/CotA-like multicopper oxidase with cupredoxin domain